jgi:hypothetical protein
MGGGSGGGKVERRELFEEAELVEEAELFEE